MPLNRPAIINFIYDKDYIGDSMVANASEENILITMGYENVAGIDESGMGCFAGDVYVAAVIFPVGIDYKNLLPGLDDSKKKSNEQRKVLYKKIKQHAVACAVATASVKEIDNLNIYWARFLAARRALKELIINPDYIIIDGNKEVPDISTPQHAIVKGDQKSISIAAASILAKVDRDDYMDDLAKKVHSDFDWESNRSYYCKATINALKKHGKTKWHREKYVAKFLAEKDNEV